MNYRIAMLVLAVTPAFAQLQLSALDGLSAKARESVEITLDQATLRLLGPGMFERGSDPEALAQMLAKLKGITIRSYEFSGANQYDMAAVQPVRDQLKGQGWSKIIEMKENQRESFELYSRVEQGKTTGFAMIAAEPNELAVIHIDGPIDIEELSRLGGRLGIPRIPGIASPVKPVIRVAPKQKAQFDGEKAAEAAAKSAEARAKAAEKVAESQAKAAAKAAERAAEARARAEKSKTPEAKTQE